MKDKTTKRFNLCECCSDPYWTGHHWHHVNRDLFPDLVMQLCATCHVILHHGKYFLVKRNLPSKEAVIAFINKRKDRMRVGKAAYDLFMEGYHASPEYARSLTDD